VLENFSFILSHLLQDDQMQAWLDLSSMEFEFLRTRFIRLLQEVGTGVLESGVQSETRLISRNFVITVLDVDRLSSLASLNIELARPAQPDPAQKQSQHGARGNVKS